MVKLDFMDACLSIPIHRSDLKFLQFHWEGSEWQFLGPPLWPEQYSLLLYQDLEAISNNN